MKTSEIENGKDYADRRGCKFRVLDKEPKWYYDYKLRKAVVVRSSATLSLVPGIKVRCDRNGEVDVIRPQRLVEAWEQYEACREREIEQKKEAARVERALVRRLVGHGFEADDVSCWRGEVTISIGEMNDLLDRLEKAQDAASNKSSRSRRG